VLTFQAHRLIAQVILVGSQVVGRAFVQAYRQAAANNAATAAAAGANGAKGAAASKISGTNLITKQTGIDLDEACKILNVNKNGLVTEEINKVPPSFLRSHSLCPSN
jgi:Pam16